MDHQTWDQPALVHMQLREDGEDCRGECVPGVGNVPAVVDIPESMGTVRDSGALHIKWLRGRRDRGGKGPPRAVSEVKRAWEVTNHSKCGQGPRRGVSGVVSFCREEAERGAGCVNRLSRGLWRCSAGTLSVTVSWVAVPICWGTECNIVDVEAEQAAGLSSLQYETVYTPQLNRAPQPGGECLGRGGEVHSPWCGFISLAPLMRSHWDGKRDYAVWLAETEKPQVDVVFESSVQFQFCTQKVQNWNWNWFYNFLKPLELELELPVPVFYSA
ncbi:hypothetical protein DFH94DRAFT_684543 [Russula ochroleuca]|uniref:Uncharacterized protein n=1 Tax=Russula ochroleuca TaxID=152965 RepID=A0A9P5K0F3_9AGAM|nr:hypothetical protein DFH94DRAFT_684543 [Russula ochroleuca]